MSLKLINNDWVLLLASLSYSQATENHKKNEFSKNTMGR
jgi:hypothetical protein